MAPLDLCLPFMGSLFIAFHRICSLLFNPAKLDLSAELEATEERSSLQTPTLILSVDAQKLHHSVPLV